MNSRLESVLRSQERPGSHEYLRTPKSEDAALDVAALLSLSDHLRKTAMVMLELEEATAEMVAERTGRRRATESDCLNQLVRMGYLQKRREGLKVFFSI